LIIDDPYTHLLVSLTAKAHANLLLHAVVESTLK